MDQDNTSSLNKKSKSTLMLANMYRHLQQKLKTLYFYLLTYSLTHSLVYFLTIVFISIYPDNFSIPYRYRIVSKSKKVILKHLGLAQSYSYKG